MGRPALRQRRAAKNAFNERQGSLRAFVIAGVDPANWSLVPQGPRSIQLSVSEPFQDPFLPTIPEQSGARAGSPHPMTWRTPVTSTLARLHRFCMRQYAPSYTGRKWPEWAAARPCRDLLNAKCWRTNPLLIQAECQPETGHSRADRSWHRYFGCKFRRLWLKQAGAQ